MVFILAGAVTLFGCNPTHARSRTFSPILPVAPASRPSADAEAKDRQSTEAPKPSDICDEPMSLDVLDVLLARTDLNQAQAAVDDCFSTVVAKLAPAYRSVLAQPPEKARLTFGYGLEEKILTSCAAPDNPLTLTLRSLGICRKLEIADIILSCSGRRITGTLAETLPKGPCAVHAEVRRHYADGERAQWISVADDGLPAGVMRDRHGRGAPIALREVLEIMDYLADHAAPQGDGYNVRSTKPYDKSSMESFLSANGVRLTNLTAGWSRVTIKSAILREIALRRGGVYEALAHLGYIYAIPYPQYSELVLTSPSATDLVLELPGWYRVTFSQEDAAWKLSAINYYEHGC